MVSTLCFGAGYLGNGTMFTDSFLMSAFSWPGNRRQAVTPDMVY